MVFMQVLVTYTVPELEERGEHEVAQDVMECAAIVRRLLGNPGPDG